MGEMAYSAESMGSELALAVMKAFKPKDGQCLWCGQAISRRHLDGCGYHLATRFLAKHGHHQPTDEEGSDAD